MQGFQRLRQLVQRILSLLSFLLLLFPLGQLFGGVADVPHHRHFLIPGGLRVNAGHIDDLYHVPANLFTIPVVDGERAVRQLRGLSVPLRSCTLYGIMVNNFDIFHQIARFQIRLSGQHNASLVNDFHVRSFHAASSTRTQMYRA